MKLLGAEEDELAEGDGERTGQLGETERRRVAAEEEIQDELLAGGDAGDETAAVLRKSGGYRVIRSLRVIGKSLERRTGRDNRRHGRRLGKRRNEAQHQLRRLPRLTRSEEIAHLLAVMPRTRRDLIAARDQRVHCLLNASNRFLHRHFHFPFPADANSPVFYHYAGNQQVSAGFPDGGRTESQKSPANARLKIFIFHLDREFQPPFTYLLT